VADLFGFIWQVRGELQLLAILVVCASSWRWGAAPERAVGTTLLAIPLADLVYHALFGRGTELVGVDIGHFLIDFAAATALTLVALYANRMYTLWLGAFQLLALTSHLVREIAPQISPIAYATMQIAPSYFQIAILWLGIWQHRRRLRTFGRYRSWSSFSPPWLQDGRGTWQRSWSSPSAG
jgi:hypothetical protein